MNTWDRIQLPHAVYRAYAGDDLLYVGCAYAPWSRMTAHFSTKDWARSITRITLEWFENEPTGKRAEAEVILAEHPRHNKLVADPEKVAPKKDRVERTGPADPTDYARARRALLKLANRPCAATGCQEMVEPPRKLCLSCRQKADRAAQDAWKARHPEKQAEYNARYGPRKSTETKAERKARYERSKLPKKSREKSQGQ